MSTSTIAADFLNNFLVRRLVTDQAADIQVNMIKAPCGHLGITRSQMPQIAGEDLPDFERYLATKGIILRKKVMPTRNLKLTQSEFNKLKVLKIMRKIGASRTFDPIIISKDGYVLDGSHRYLAVHNSRADATMPTLKASVNIRELLDAARSYPKVTFRTYSDNKAS